MTKKDAMRQSGLRYFCQLTAKQKCDTISFIRIMKNDLHNLPNGLAMEILKNRDLDIVIRENELIDKQLKGQRFFKHNKTYIPLNIKELK